MNKTPITEEESFLIQSQALVECLVKLGELEAARDVDFEKLKEQIYGRTAKEIKQENPDIPIFSGQGVLLTAFYLLLVLPRELNSKKFNDAYHMTEAEAAARQAAQNFCNTYETQKPILTHFRNALSHGRIGWKENRLTIADESGSKRFYAEFEMDDLGAIIEKLNMAFLAYVENVLKKR